ncbi:siroheme decarboxylase subunit beta [Coralliovum pocilloporae]|uniref:siroheme decarboxylase subunit beta n=1 Tax=Coralliovum pocilloporae TaxID=3066369 RepID=UPI003306A527
MTSLSEQDRKLIAALQAGLPRCSRPWQVVADQTGMTENDVLARVRSMQEEGIIRRVAAVPNHYALGMTANGMSVWDIDDEAVDRLGEVIGALPYVSHCYRRPRHMPDWPYNLFAMVHGANRDDVMKQVSLIAQELGDVVHQHDVLFSKSILKKTGFRLTQGNI